MADVNQAKAPDAIDWSNYSDGKTIIPAPLAGEVGLQTTKVDWGTTRDGYLQAVLSVKVIAPGKDGDGHEAGFIRVSTKKWPNRNGSPMGDYLRAHGVAAAPTTNEEYTSLVNATIGRAADAAVDRRGWDKVTSTPYEDAAFIVDGKPVNFLQLENPERRVFANLNVRFFKSAIKK